MRNEREAAGVCDRFSEMHPYSQPFVDISLLGKLLDLCVAYDMDEGVTSLRWSQGGVIIVSNGSNIVKPGTIIALFQAGDGVIISWYANVLCI